MAGRRDKNLLGPPAVCNVCGCAAATLHAVGTTCPRCGQGEMIHRKFWRFSPCPRCQWQQGGLCSICGGMGFTAIPREDITIMDLSLYHPGIGFIEGDEEGEPQGHPEEIKRTP